MIDLWCIGGYVFFLLFLLLMVPSADGSSCSICGEGARSIVQKKTMYIVIIYLILLFYQDEIPQVREKTSIRKRRSVRSIFTELGTYYTRRAYRMPEAKFFELHRIIYKEMKYNISPPSNSKKKGNKNGARNGLIPSLTRLSCAIRYFAGGSAYDIAIAHGVLVRQVYTSVWRVVDAVNNTSSLDIVFPDYDEQERIS